MTAQQGSQLSTMQRRRLTRLLRDAVVNVPWYRREYARLGLSPDALSDAGVLHALPVLSKSALIDIAPRDRLNARFDISRLTEEATTGSTGQPFSIWVDRGYKMRRNRRFLRALWAAGYRPGQRLMLLTDRVSESVTRPWGWHYCPVEQPTAAIARDYLRFRPATLYGFATPLRLLAAFLEQHAAAHRPDRLITTAEMLSAGTRACLAGAFGCPVFDFYGMTEMGLVAAQRIGRKDYALAPEIITELVPDGSCANRRRMVMTNLDLRCCPIIRFDSGDVASVEERNGVTEIVGFEGRSIDSILCRDGSELSPYRITDALRDVPGLKQFKITQSDLLDFIVAVEIDASLCGGAVARIETILTELLGRDIRMRFEFTDRLIPDGAVKFRPVESRVARC